MIKRNPLPNEHAARQKPPELFKTFRRSKSFRNKPLPSGISVIYGIRKEKGPRGGSTEIQSFRFDKNKWGVREAKKWLKDNGFETKIEKAVKTTKRKTNPYNSDPGYYGRIIRTLENNSDVKNLKEIGYGAQGTVFYFNVTKRTFVLDDILLDKGEYIIKILTDYRHSIDNMNQLQLLSNYGLIPKIYYIDKNSMIMKYINGETLREFQKKEKDPNIIKIINDKVFRLEEIWWMVNKFQHEDLNFSNILVTKDLKVYFIDPIIIDL